ncbi:MAG TPA: hypothetical protein VE960_00190, partial [bacterium]|nr:hypothetical protein [bacterium]
MRRALMITVALMSLAILLAGSASAADWKSFRPAEHAGRTKISVGGKELTYYQFSEDEPVAFSVEGPTRLKILTRVRVPSGRESVEYGVSVSMDGVHQETVEKEAYPKDGAFYVASDDFRPGVIRRVYIDVPTGRHGYELRAVGGHTVDARFFESAES